MQIYKTPRSGQLTADSQSSLVPSCAVLQKRKFQKLNLDFLELNFDSSASNLKPDSLTENSKGKITKHLNP